jgi:hypothetical protein
LKPGCVGALSLDAFGAAGPTAGRTIAPGIFASFTRTGLSLAFTVRVSMRCPGFTNVSLWRRWGSAKSPLKVTSQGVAEQSSIVSSRTIAPAGSVTT